VALEGLLLVNGDDPRAVQAASSALCGVETFGIDAPADWHAGDLEDVDGCYAFSVRHRDEDCGRFALRIPGRHYVTDACAAVAVSVSAGADLEACREALADFTGAARRFEVVGEMGGVVVVDDYAHHPTEIRATLGAVRRRFPGSRIWCVFQPHQHSRTRFLLADFARSFEDADRVLLPDIYFVRDSDEERRAVSSADLVAAIHDLGRLDEEVRYVPAFEEIEEALLRECAPGDVLITMGAGDVWKLGRRVLERLGAHGPSTCAAGAADDVRDRRRS
jgi:UDP-N-acetylmuramate--alanine ligase